MFLANWFIYIYMCELLLMSDMSTEVESSGDFIWSEFANGSQ